MAATGLSASTSPLAVTLPIRNRSGAREEALVQLVAENARGEDARILGGHVEAAEVGVAAREERRCIRVRADEPSDGEPCGPCLDCRVASTEHRALQ